MFTESRPPHQIYYNLGWILQQQADLEQAADRYRKAILVGRKSGQAAACADAHHNLGVILVQQERWLAASYHYRRSINLRPTLLAFCNLGTALLQQGDTQAAIEIYQQATKLPEEASPVWANLYHHLAQALQQQRRLGEAIAAYHQALAIDPDKAEVHYNLGRALNQQGRYSEAIDCFQTALRLNRDLKVAWGECGLAWLMTGQIERALQSFRQAIAPDQAFIAAHCNGIRSQPVGDEFERARLACAEFLTALQTDSEPDRSLRASLGQALMHWANLLSDYGGAAQLHYAEQLYQHALRLQPQQLELYRRLARCLARQQRFAAAIATCHLALTIDPQSTAIQTELDRVQRSTKLTRSPNTPTCQGLNCEPCLQRLTLKFAPVRLTEGIYQLDGRSPIPADPIDRSVTTLANGRIWVAPQPSGWQACSTIAVFSAERERLTSLSRSYPGQLPNCDQAAVPLQGVPDPLPPSLRVKGRVAALSSLSGSVYFHWMIDLLPRLEILQQQIDLQQIDYFLVNSDQRSFQRETLQAFGIDFDRIIESDRHPHIQAEQLIVPSFVGSLGWAQPEAIEFLRKQFLPKTERNFSPNLYQKNHCDLPRSIDQSPQDFSFIYLSRTDARYRRLLNEDQVLDALRPYGFVALTLDTLSVAEQAALFAGARVIVAPHGSSLTNLVFCSPQTQVVELVSPNYQRHYFWRISQLLNLTHYVIQGKRMTCQFLRRLMYPNPLLEDIWIDVDRLHQVLETIFPIRITTET